MNYTFVVPCLFGLEGIVSDEIKMLGYETAPENGRVKFFGTLEAMARVNMFMRCGERVLIEVGEFEARTFTELFDNTKSLPWENFISKGGEFPVKGHSLNSTLFSVSDCQAIIKKAVVDRLKTKYKIEWFAEDMERYQIQFGIMKDKVTLMIDTSGDGLHKRGYRKNANAAPLRETLAAAMVKLSRYRTGRTFVDPMCGSGTIAIEAAMIGENRASGLNRGFAYEHFAFAPKDLLSKAKEEAMDIIKTESFTVGAFDIDETAISLTKNNARLAGVGTKVKTAVCDVNNFKTATENGIIVTNPPYGERLLDKKEAEGLYRDMGRCFMALNDWQYFILTSHENFESYFGKKADKKRKLYNGMIKCDFYQYFRRQNNENNRAFAEKKR